MPFLRNRARRSLARSFALMLLLVVGTLRAEADAQGLIDAYLVAWGDFYPSRAFASGDARRAAAFEDFSDERLELWLAYNEATRRRARALLASETETLAADRRTDLRVLLAHSDDEIATWAEERPRETRPKWYAEQLSQALTHLLVRDQLDPSERRDALVARLTGVAELCALGSRRLRSGTRMGVERALRTVASTRAFYDTGLRRIAGEGAAVDAAIDRALAALADFEAFLNTRILPRAEDRTAIGASAYVARLARRSAGAYDATTLLEEAAAEMREVRGLMVDEARRWQVSAGLGPRPADGDAILAQALEAMESDRDATQVTFLDTFRRLTLSAERFVRERDIATVPTPTTLYIDLSPAHFSGAAVGGVYPSGPFAPDAVTLFYVPSIADSAPADAREGFYRSFNTPFNTMIISHEMFPGHYLQYKVAVREAPAVRSLFPNGAYVEGWGSFVEELMLDAGWADNAPLVRLAHLRKRLENATRAYVSVQVHTAGWGEERVLAFARDEGLLAPQFARNLWQRAVHSPLQITDYMRGYRQFKRLWAARSRGTSTRAWVDGVLRAGPVPIAYLYEEAGP